MSCAYEQITVSGLSHPTFDNINGVYVKVSQTPGFPGIAVNYWKDTGLKDYGFGLILSTGYRLIGPLPTSGNTFRILFLAYEGSSVDDPDASPFESTSLVRTNTDQGAICPDLLTGWTNLGSTTGTILITGPQVPEPTFGLPADVVALITSRFGTVANFLRLRNQGYI